VSAIVAEFRHKKSGAHLTLRLELLYIEKTFWFWLLSNGAIPVSSTSFMEAMARHVLTEQKKDRRQEDYEQEPYDFKPN
jgi:hypothetical protein